MLAGHLARKLYAESVVDVSDVAEEIGKGAGAAIMRHSGALATVGVQNGFGVPWAVGGGARRVSQILAGRRPGRRDIPGNLGRIPNGRQEAEGSRPSLRSDRWAQPSATRRDGGIPICGRGAARSSRPTAKDRRASTARRQSRSVKFRGAALERDDGRGRARLGTIRATIAPFLSGSISATNKRRLDIPRGQGKSRTSYLTESGKPMKDDILHAKIPKGPGGQFNLGGGSTDHSHGAIRRTRRPAKDFLRWVHSKTGLRGMVLPSQAGPIPVAPPWSGSRIPVWTVDPVLRPFKDLARAPADWWATPGAPKTATLPRVVTKIHHRRHVREGDPRHGRRGCGSNGRMNELVKIYRPEPAVTLLRRPPPHHLPRRFPNDLYFSRCPERLRRQSEGADRLPGCSKTNVGWRYCLLLPTLVASSGFFIAYPFFQGCGAIGNRYQSRCAGPICRAYRTSKRSGTTASSTSQCGILCLYTFRHDGFQARPGVCGLATAIEQTISRAKPSLEPSSCCLHHPDSAVYPRLEVDVSIPRSSVINLDAVPARDYRPPRINWLGDPHLALISVMIVNVWRGVPFYCDQPTCRVCRRSVRSCMRRPPIDGARAWQRFRHVTWPLLLPVTFGDRPCSR